MAVQIPFPLPSHGYALNSKMRINLDFLVDQFNQFNSGSATWDTVSIGTANSLTGTLTFYNASNAYYLTLKPGTTAAGNLTFTLPTAYPGANPGALISDLTGTTAWKSVLGTSSQITVTNNTSDLTFSLPAAVILGTSTSVTGSIAFYNASNAFTVKFQPGTTAAGSLTFTLPVAFPSAAGLMQSSSAGVLSFVSASSGIVTSDGSSFSMTSGTGVVSASSGTLSFTSGTGAFYHTSGGFGFSGAASVSNALAKISTGGAVSAADHSYSITAASNGLLYIASGVAVDVLANSLGTTGMLIGGTSGTPKFVQLLGTSNEIIVTINTNDITLTTPQAIGTGSDVTFNSVTSSSYVKTGAGSVSLNAIRLNANNTGLFMASATEMDFVIGGTTYAALDNSGNWFATSGEIRGNDIRALRYLKVSGSSAGIVTMVARSSFTDYTLTLPSDDGNSGDVLKTDGSGGLSWVSVSAAGGATTALDNLASVAINTSLLPGSDNSIDAGSSSKNFRSLYFSTSLKNGATTLATATEVGYLTGVTSAIQTQIDGKSPTAGNSSLVTVGTVTSGTWSATTIAVNKGGTGQTSYTDGQLLIGNTTGNTLAKATLTGTSNQVVVTNGSGTITLSTPQDIGTASSPTFAAATITNTTNQFVLGATRTVTITAPTPASSSRTWTIPDITGNGTFAALEGTQTFSGAKTFSTNLVVQAAVAASTLFFTCNNTDNTNTASHAQGLIKSGGSSAGDAYMQFTIASATDWSIGCDNSASDDFVLSRADTLGSSNILSATSALLRIHVPPKFAGTNSTGSGSAALGSNSPATTNTAPYTWINAQSSDGSTVYIPCWK